MSLVESTSSGCDGDVLKNLKLIFSRKATSTINKRSSSLEAYPQWRSRGGKPSLPARGSHTPHSRSGDALYGEQVGHPRSPGGSGLPLHIPRLPWC
eukprot:3513125-Amphidinium_carterae.1